MNTTLIISSFIAGVLTILAPCVLPLLPVIIGSGAGSRSIQRPIIATISLGVSIVIFTLLLKFSTALIGIPEKFWQSLSGAIVLFFGVFLLFPNLWNKISERLGLDQSSHRWLNLASGNESNVGPILLGASLGPVFSSCSPTYLIILATVLPTNFTAGVFYLSLYSLGLMLTLGLIGVFGQQIISKLRWAANPNGLFKRSTGILLILVGVLVASGYNKTIEAKILNSKYNLTGLEEKLLPQPTTDTVTQVQAAAAKGQYQKYSRAKVNHAQKEGVPYAFFFHADWCSTCQALEKKILANLEKLPKKSIIFKVNYDKESQLKQRLQILTQSTVIFFNAAGDEIGRAINPKLERILKDLSADNPSQHNEKLSDPEMEKKLEKIKDKKNIFGTAKEYYAFLLGKGSLKQATFAGGCFWCLEGPFEARKGVVEVFSGYAGGNIAHPTYSQVSRGNTGAREAVDVFYDPRLISFEELIEVYWRQIDPTDAEGQFADQSFQYTTAIYYRNDKEKQQAYLSKRELETSGEFSQVATQILPYKTFSLAEEYHQDYYKKKSHHYKRYKIGSGRQGNIKRNKKVFDKLFDKKDKKEKAGYKRPDQSKIRSMLDSKAYAVTQKGDTERPFHNAYWNNHEAGIYVDVVTGEPLFSSTDKFDSGTGWPSFSRPIDDNFISKHKDNKLFMTRTEVKSKVGNSHLGHVFKDGPKDKGGLRYCINSAALRFIPLSEMKKRGYGQYLSLFQ